MGGLGPWDIYPQSLCYERDGTALWGMPAMLRRGGGKGMACHRLYDKNERGNGCPYQRDNGLEACPNCL